MSFLKVELLIEMIYAFGDYRTPDVLGSVGCAQFQIATPMKRIQIMTAPTTQFSKTIQDEKPQH